ncbi:MAG: anti-phage-associated DUF1156 domain-containing protein [Betaproteobacteria bacterium]|jgi:putative DNA methylase
MSSGVVPFSLKDAPSLIERLLPVQKLSAEAYKEQMAVHGKTLTALGSYWKGRKPLILNKACILGCLLPATSDPGKDLEVFELLMGMDTSSFVARAKRRLSPKEILESVVISRVADYFQIVGGQTQLVSSPVDWSDPALSETQVKWRDDVSEVTRRAIEASHTQTRPYRERVRDSRRPEEVQEAVDAHVWDTVNEHLGTHATSIPELVGQLGVMRFGRRPRVGDTFCGSGQIPFEAARIGCDAHASDLNPIACMLTWGAFSIVGASSVDRDRLVKEQQELARELRRQVDQLGIEDDGDGWRAKVFLYCIEVRCPQTGWLVPLLPSRVISYGYRVVAELLPDVRNKRYEIVIRSGANESEMLAAEKGTIGRDSRFDEASLEHTVDGSVFRTKISTLRGDYINFEGVLGNSLRQWELHDFRPRSSDLLQERLYCIEWMRPKKKGKGFEYEFRSVTDSDLQREQVVDDYVATHLSQWQTSGAVPDMRIEVGGPPRYQGQDLVRSRGWTYWHHVFNGRQLLLGAIVNEHSGAFGKFALTRMLNKNSRLSRWDGNVGGGGATQGVFDNQALNTLFNYGTRGVANLDDALVTDYKSFHLHGTHTVRAAPAKELQNDCDIFVTDPPYGDAVKYEEILDFFVSWLRRKPPADFADWVWDSRRSLAIQGEGEDFRREMVAAYSQMAARMPANGLQVVMFTHQSGSLWADMANIVWASGLQASAAWYVATETDSALREGSHVKGTVLLVLRKRQGQHKTTRDDLAWEIQEEVEKQVADLTGLNQQAKGLYRDENVFEDADIQMAGYAAALRVLTRYAVIDGREMSTEAIRPRVKGETTFVDGLIAFAVDTANQCLVPQGVAKAHWDRLSGAERFYLKMLDMEARGAKTLDNYQNFAKAFKVRDFGPLLASRKANEARLKSGVDFGRAEMGEGSELYQSVLRAALYAVMELQNGVDGSEVLAHLTLNVPNYYSDVTQRELVAELAGYLAKRLEALRPDEASAARVLRELVKNQRLG